MKNCLWMGLRLSFVALSSPLSADIIALFGNTNAGSTAASNSPVTSQTNGAVPVANVTTSNITGAGLNANASQFFLRNQFGTGLWITGSSPTGAGGASSDLWIGVNNQNWGTVAGSVSTSHYLEFTVTAASGFTLDLDNLTFNWQAAINNQTSVLSFGYQLFASTNGGAFNSVGSAGTKAVSNALGASSDWGTITSENINLNSLDGANSVSFRLAMDNPINTTAGSYVQFFRNISVNGVAVPEPSAAVLSVLVMGAFGFNRRRQLISN